MAWIGDEIKDDIYKDLYFNSEDKYFNAGMLNLVNLADRDEQQRKAIARQGNAESIKQRRISKGIKACKRFNHFQDRYFKDPAVIKSNDGRQLTKKETAHLTAINSRYDRLELAYKQISEQAKELYGIDIAEETRKQEELESIYNFKKISAELLKEIERSYYIIKKAKLTRF